MSPVDCRVAFDSPDQMGEFLAFCLRALDLCRPPHGLLPGEFRSLRHAAAKALGRCEAGRLACESSLVLSAFDWAALLNLVGWFYDSAPRSPTDRPDAVLWIGIVGGRLRSGRRYARVCRWANRLLALNRSWAANVVLRRSGRK